MHLIVILLIVALIPEFFLLVLIKGLGLISRVVVLGIILGLITVFSYGFLTVIHSLFSINDQTWGLIQGFTLLTVFILVATEASNRFPITRFIKSKLFTI